MFFRRLEIYTEVPQTTEMMDLVIKIMVEVLSILAIARKEIEQGRKSEQSITSMSPLTVVFFRKIPEEVVRKYRLGRCAGEVRQADTRRGSNGCCTKLEG